MQRPTSPPWLRRTGFIFTEVLVVLALFYSAHQLYLKAVLYLAGLHGPDATLYWTMGRAIRNGLTIYKDIFDPKPPGMFLLSAASFALFHNGAIGYILNVLILFAIPILFVGWTAIYAKTEPRPKRLTLLQLGLLIGLAIGLYNATIGGDWQTEFYGAFFGLLYVAAIDAYQRRKRLWPIILGCVSFSIALLLKEPFLIALLAVAVVMLKTRDEWVKFFGFPVLAACALYSVVLLSLGAFDSYVTIYLRAMLGNYIVRSGPVWIRGLVAWERIFINVRDFSALFPILIATLFCFALPATRHGRERTWRIAVAFSGFALLLLARSFAQQYFAWKFAPLPSLLLLIIGICAVLISAKPREVPAFFQKIGRPILGLYLTFTAIGLGSDFHGQYFALAIPFYAALFLLLLRQRSGPLSCKRIGPLLGCTVLATAVLLTSVPFLRTNATLTSAIEKMQTEEKMQRQDAAMFDRILDACAVDRYYFLEDHDYAAYMRHSPLTYYLFTRIEHIDRYHPLFWHESFARLASARVIILKKPYAPVPHSGNAIEQSIAANMNTLLTGRFTEKPPACARSLPVPDGYSVLFRREPLDSSLPASSPQP